MDPISRAAKSWYGYGRWDAPYWFIGLEPGMRADEGERLLERCSAWERLGSPELMGCLEHHDAFGYLVDEFGLRFVGSVIPSFDSQADLSASALTDLVAKVKAQGDLR